MGKEMISPGYTSQDKLWLLAEGIMRRTQLRELLDIAVPVLGAPMGPDITSLELATAVSNASGLGIISFGGQSASRAKRTVKNRGSLMPANGGVRAKG